MLFVTKDLYKKEKKSIKVGYLISQILADYTWASGGYYVLYMILHGIFAYFVKHLLLQ